VVKPDNFRIRGEGKGPQPTVSCGVARSDVTGLCFGCGARSLEERRRKILVWSGPALDADLPRMKLHVCSSIFTFRCLIYMLLHALMPADLPYFVEARASNGL
jgi:hypothetical protein